MSTVSLKRLAHELSIFNLQDKYYIVDCLGYVAGNRNGYHTMRGAIQQADSTKSKVHRDLWRTFNSWDDRNPSENLVYSIVSGESLINTLLNKGQ